MRQKHWWLNFNRLQKHICYSIKKVSKSLDPNDSRCRRSRNKWSISLFVTSYIINTKCIYSYFAVSSVSSTMNSNTLTQLVRASVWYSSTSQVSQVKELKLWVEQTERVTRTLPSWTPAKASLLLGLARSGTAEVCTYYVVRNRWNYSKWSGLVTYRPSF